MAAWRLSPRALRDIDEAATCLAGHNPAAAARLIDRVESVCERLADHPRMGVRRDELFPGLRAFPADNFIVYYSVDGRGILVQRVLDGRRDIPGLFGSDD